MIYIDVDTAVVLPLNSFPLLDDTDFKTIEIGVVYNSAGLVINWNFVTSAGVTTMNAITATTAGVFDITEPVADKGMYAIELPASGSAAGSNNDREGYGWFTGVATGILPWSSPMYCFRIAATNDALCDGGDLLDVSMTQILGTAVSTPATAGILDVNTKNMNNVAATSITAISAVIGTAQPVNFTGTGASALAKSDMVDVAGAAVSTTAAQIGVNTVSLTANAITAASINAAAFTSAKFATDAITAASIATDAITEIQAGLATPTNITTVATVTNLTNLPAAAATSAELAKVPKSDSTVTWNVTALASINAECDTAVAVATALIGTPLDFGNGLLTVAGNLSHIHSEIEGIAVTGAALNVLADGRTLTTGTESSGTYASTALDNGNYHVITAAGGTTNARIIDLEYLFTLPTAAGVPVEIEVVGYLKETAPAGGDVISLQYYNYDTPGWEIADAAVFTGITGTTDVSIIHAMFSRFVGKTGGDTGKIRIRFYSTTLEDNATLNIDQIYIAYAEAVSASIITLVSETAKIPKSDASVTWNATALASINAEVDTALNTVIPTSNTANSVNDILLDVVPTIKTDTVAILVDTGTTLDARIPSALVGGRMDSYTGAMATDVVTAAAIATDAITEIQSGLATPINITAGTITTVTNLTNAPTNGDLTSAMKSSITTAVPTVAAIADGTWDEQLTGATHNVSTSAGRRLRETASTVIWTGMAQGAGANGNQIQLDTGASSVNGSYDPSLIAIVVGTGAGQCRLIMQYSGSNRMATVDRDWKVNPSTDSEFIVYAHPGREHVNEGLAQAGGASAITLNANASSLNGNYIGQTVFIRSGTGQDQVRVISAYNGTTKVATISEAWGVEPDVTSCYVMLPTSAPTVVAIADGTWDELLSGHTVSGSAGLALSTASSGGVDPAVLADAVCDELLSGHTITGSVGKKLGDLQILSAADVNTQCDTAISDVGLTTTITGRIDAAITSRGTGVALDAAGVRSAVGLASANLDTQLATVAGYVDTEVAAIKVVTDRLNTAIVLDGSVYKFTTNALEDAPAGGGGSAPTVGEIDTQLSATHGSGLWGGGTTGSNQVTISVVDEGAIPIPGVLVQVLNSDQTLVLNSDTTDPLGVVVTTADNGTYKIRLSKWGVTFTVPETLVVSGNTVATPYVGAVSSSSTTQELRIIPTDPSLLLNPLASVYAQVKYLNSTSGLSSITHVKVYATNMTTYFYVILAKGVEYQIVGTLTGVKFIDQLITIDQTDMTYLSSY